MDFEKMDNIFCEENMGMQLQLSNADIICDDEGNDIYQAYFEFPFGLIVLCSNGHWVYYSKEELD